MNTPPPGRLIGASLGPGDPGLITRRAWAALQSGARWLYPVMRSSSAMARGASLWATIFHCTSLSRSSVCTSGLAPCAT